MSDTNMNAMIFQAQGRPLQHVELPRPACGPNDVLIQVHACGVCRTDLHILDGELKNPKLPLIPGHEIVGTVIAKGISVRFYDIGDRLGVPWLAHTCGLCPYCLSQRENLCEEALFTGYTVDGGYAEYAVADYRYCFPLPDIYTDTAAAPLLCAGLIGYRALVACNEAARIGIYGFGAAAHIITQLARWQGWEIFAFTKPGDRAGQHFATELGASWAGDSSNAPPAAMEAAILFAPVGSLIPEALSHLAKGGSVICAGIHMSDIPAFPYAILWGERSIKSIANLTRQDGDEFFKIAPRAGIKTEVTTFPLAEANTALARLKDGSIKGAAVLVMN
jgi:alcohol dehydrogenase, propanol-preferring